jgi:hypothetical protein
MDGVSNRTPTNPDGIAEDVDGRRIANSCLYWAYKEAEGAEPLLGLAGVPPAWSLARS